MTLKVALLGLGNMGIGLAQNILKAGFPLTVYNRTRARAESLVGATVANSPAEAVREADVVISVVSDDNASRQIWLGKDGALAAAKSGEILVECSTLSLTWIKELAEESAQRGFALLDVPIAGGKDAAAAGTVTLLVGGDAAALEKVRPVLASFSQHIEHLGPAGSGAAMKLVNNLMIGIQAVALAEGLALAERLGLNMEQVSTLISNGGPGGRFVRGAIGRMATHDTGTVNFALGLMHKDMTYALQAAHSMNVPMFAVAIANEVYRLACQQGFAESDVVAVSEVFREK